MLESCLAAVQAGPAVIGLPAVDRAIVVLVDGLGAEALSARAGHARALSGALTSKSAIVAGFPSTTATAITSLTTGLRAGAHGIVGYSALDPARDAVVNQLTGWGPHLDPLDWQRHPTLFERAAADGIAAVAIGPERYRESGFTQVALRGAKYLAGATIDDRVSRAIEWLSTSGPGIAYLYVPELDVAAHAKGWTSGEWTAALEVADSALRRLADSLGPREGMLVTADHGIVDVPHHAHILVDTAPELLEGVRHLAGEPRCLQLHLEPEANASVVFDRWAESESGHSWVATRQEVIDAGWYGPVDDTVRPRMGDIFIAARKSVAYYDSRTAGSSRNMVGQHGSLSQTELRVPLLRFGAFAA
ncbi:putative AlkP superfamily pyrophosphatase or phosphodiesterase [Leifsonia sp. AK011]|uniref:alkaline phosphatase family protein n=1 Tax=Leifsonia sp. AK011 TaxID=2723075 RepID=UPI0017DA57A4|nr:alkaline phosphatase family protein [Leifsonia sp. AK011]NYF10836.1 putative AlkP superfamily pyrophosphatase or phosphodiesterase [Leifsonia sp. AK011]